MYKPSPCIKGLDTNDPGYKILSDHEIVHNLVEESDTEGEKNKTDDDLTEGEYGSCYSETFDALDSVFKWFEKRHSFATIKKTKELSCSKEKVNNEID